MPSRSRSEPAGMIKSHQQVLISFCQISYPKRRKLTRVLTLDQLTPGRNGIGNCCHMGWTSPLPLLSGMKKGWMNASSTERFADLIVLSDKVNVSVVWSLSELPAHWVQRDVFIVQRAKRSGWIVPALGTYPDPFNVVII